MVVAINGGPRKNWNTAMLLEEALKGAEAEGAETKLIHLYDLNFKGCVSCFACKTREKYNLGVCARQDELRPVLELLDNASGVVLGSPIYLSDVTGVLRQFIERYFFIHLAYDPENSSLYKRGPGMAFFYTMNIPEEKFGVFNLNMLFDTHLKICARLQPPFVEQLFATDTMQFKDYGKFYAPLFDPALKKKSREERFPKDLAKANELGRKLGRLSEKPLLFKDS
jgi:multimeric flavodoxin WrbA